MHVLKSIDSFQTFRQGLTGRVGFVPTMGYLHDGHMSLVEQAVSECDSVVASIYVNPTQFGANEDFSSYPRDLSRDLQLLEKGGVDLVFIPTNRIMYSPFFQTTVSVSRVSEGLEGGQRPGHFQGVATIVAKLFNITQPDVAFFSLKDSQQCVVIRQMVRDLNFPVEIAVCPVCRESDGLAMSSRNVYLTDAEREAASAVNRALRSAAKAYNEGERDPETLIGIANDVICKEPLATTDYLSINHAHTLQPINEPIHEPVLMSTAVRIGRVRLLDATLLPESLNNRYDASLILGAGENM